MTRQAFHLHARRKRMQGAIVVLVLVLGFLNVGLFRTQVLRTSSYVLQSEANRLRPLEVPAPRGTIYDRNGEIVADNTPAYALLLLPASRDSLQKRLNILAPLLGITQERVEQLLVRQSQYPSQPLVVSADLGFEQVSAVEERRFLLPGIYVETRPKRRYPAAEAIAHMVGFVAEISRSELESPAFVGYRPGQLVGKAGIELRHEGLLAGTPGVRYVEVDALGRIVGELRPRPEVAAVPGEELHLHLDLGLQQWIHEIFPEDMRGAVAVLEPGSGHVLALYSSPTYDPNLLVGGVQAAHWQELNREGSPLFHRAISGRYAPGSVFKLATALIALQHDLVQPDETMPISCRGGMWYGNQFYRCWEQAGHGFLALAEAIQRSCNVYFYQLGARIGLERFFEEGTRLGLSRTTGIDLPGERASSFPPDPFFYEHRFGARPTPVEALFLAIGQGPVEFTVLNLAQFFAALAVDGRAPPPRISAVQSLESSSDTLDLSASPEVLEVLREGMRRVVGPGGTAHLSSLEHWELAGKTGTAQNPDPDGRAHGWFVGMAGKPDSQPEVVVAAIVELAESGSKTAQFVAKIADFYLRRKHGIPVDTIQTLGEHLEFGRSAPWARWQ